MAAILRANRAFLRPWDPDRPPTFFTQAGQRDIIRAGLAEREAGHAWSFGIFEQAGDDLVGRIALSSVVRGAWQNANVGYWVVRDRNGRGYCTEALSGAMTFAFDLLQLHRIQAAIMPRNAASIRVVEKNGFRQEGVLRQAYRVGENRYSDDAVYSLLASEWRERQM